MIKSFKIRMISCILILTACKTASTGTHSSALDGGRAPTGPLLAMHDVSVLFPEADDEGEDFFLRPHSPGKGGALIPASLDLEAIPNSKSFRSSSTLPHARVVSFRIDPCFPRIELLDTRPELCSAQIRLVLVADTVNAFHAVYKLTRPEIEALTKEVAALGDHSPAGLSAPLGVHPKMAAEGIEGPTAQAMRAIVLKYAGTQNMIGLAHFNFLVPPARSWTFQANNVADGKLIPVKIPTLGDTLSQPFRVNGTGVTAGVGTGFAIEAEEGNLDLKEMAVIVNDKVELKASTADINKALSYAARLNNPTLTHFDSAPCVSCHIASSATGETLRLRSIELKKDPNIFQSSHNLELISKESKRFTDPRNFASADGISQRTVNETATVVDAMIKHGFYK